MATDKKKKDDGMQSIRDLYDSYSSGNNYNNTSGDNGTAMAKIRANYSNYTKSNVNNAPTVPLGGNSGNGLNIANDLYRQKGVTPNQAVYNTALNLLSRQAEQNPLPQRKAVTQQDAMRLQDLDRSLDLLRSQSTSDRYAKNEVANANRNEWKSITGYDYTDPTELNNRQRLAHYNTIKGAEDFDTKSAFNEGIEDYQYRRANGMENGVKWVDPLNRKRDVADSFGNASRFISDDEKKMYNYLYETEGKEAAEQYYNDLDLTRRKASAEQTFDEMSYRPVASDIMSVLYGPQKAEGLIGAAFDLASGKEVDPNADYFRSTRGQKNIRNITSENILGEDPNFGNKALNFAYQTGMSMADFMFNSAISGGFGGIGGTLGEAMSLATMGAGAAADSMQEARENGIDSKRAVVLGTIAGIAEIFTEKVSLETLLDPELIADGSLKYILKNMLAEGSEESASDLINWTSELFYDFWTGADKSELLSTYGKYKDEGYGNGEAIFKTVMDMGSQLLVDALGGALSGGVMAGGGSIANNIRNNVQTGRDIREGEQNYDVTTSVVEEGLSGEFGKKAQRNATRMANQFNSGKNLTDYQLGRQFNLNQKGDTRNLQLEAQRESLGNALDTVRIGEQTKDVAVRLYDGKTSLSEYYAQVLDIQNAAEQNVPMDEIQQREGVSLNAEEVKDIYMAVKNDQMEVTPIDEVKPTETIETEEMTDGRENALREESGNWNDSTNSREPGTELLEGTEQNVTERRNDTREVSAESKRNFNELPKVTENDSFKSLPLDNSNTARVVDSTYSPEVKEAVDYATGYNVKANVFVGSNLSLSDSGGTAVVNGVKSGNSIFFRADHKDFKPIQIAKHEVFHQFLDNGIISKKEARRAVKSAIGDKAYNDIRNVYADMYRGSGVDYESEMLCDLHGGMNVFGQRLNQNMFTSKALVSKVPIASEELTRMTDSRGEDLKNIITDSNGNIVNTTRMSAEEKSAVESIKNKLDKVITDSNGRLLLATTTDGSQMRYSEETYRKGGRQALENALMEKYGDRIAVNRTLNFIDQKLELIKQYGLEYSQKYFSNLAKNLEKGIVTDIVTGKQSIYTFVPNGDYAANMDLQLNCKKRIAYGQIIDRLIKDGVLENVRYGGAAIAEVNQILAENEFETACLGCFVESRRLQLQAWAETFVSEWNEAVEKINPGADYFFSENGDAISRDDAISAFSRLENEVRNEKGNINLGKGGATAKMPRLIEKDVKLFGHKLTVADLLTPEGLERVRTKIGGGDVFSLIKQRYGAASPKIVQSFNPYNSEILSLSFASLKEMTGNSVASSSYVERAKAELGDAGMEESRNEIRELYGDNLKKAELEKLAKEVFNTKVQENAFRQYLYDIGGLRIQSFSDFMIENVFDMLQIFTDMSVQNFPIHGYTKEITCLRLFGMTGAKWNGSLIAHVDRTMGKEYAGLMPYTEENLKHGVPVTVDGEQYVIQFDDFKRNQELGKYNASNPNGSFIQSIGYKDVMALMLDPRYSKNVGNITIGVSDKQIRAMLNNPLFRMVIPYHSSGMLPQFAELVGVNFYNDYTDYQNTTINSMTDKNGKKLSYKKGKGGKIKVLLGGKYVDANVDLGYDFNAKMNELGDARAAADDYIEWCKNPENHEITVDGNLVGYAVFNPKFNNSKDGYDFTKEPNYYKLLEDFNVYDSLEEVRGYDFKKNVSADGSQIPALQEGVILAYPGDGLSADTTLTSSQLEQYAKDLKATGVFTDDDIKNYVAKAKMNFDEIVKAELDTRSYYNEKQFGKKTDSNGNKLPSKFDTALTEIEELLTSKYGRELRAETAKQYVSAKQSADKKKTLELQNKASKKPIKGAYGNIQYSRDSSQDRDNRLKFGSMFSGAGTVDFALRNIIAPQFAVEYDAKIAGVFKENNGEEIFVGDVRDFDLTGKNADYFHASPVCKNFSNAKTNGGEQPIDIETARAAANAIDKLQPKYFTLENVPRYRNSEAMKLITDALKRNGYNYDIDTYRASEYGGATIRERLFVRATKGELPPKPQTKMAQSWYDVSKDLIDDLPESPFPKGGYMETRWNEIKDSVDTTKPVLILSGNKGGGLVYAEANKPSPTITASMTEQRIVMPDGRVLRATPRVMARIQGLPDSFALPKQITTAYKVIGNGVPLQMTQAVAGSLIEPEKQGLKFSRAFDSKGNNISSEKMDLLADTKIRTEDGKVLRLYHGSPSTDIEMFDVDKAGRHTGNFGEKAIWFTDNEKFADDMAYEFEEGSSRFTVTRGKRGKVYESYLNMTNPFDLTNPTEDMLDLLYTLDDKAHVDKLLKIGNHQLLKSYIEDYGVLRDAGYDGIIAKLGVNKEGLEYGVFSSDQVVSVDEEFQSSDDKIKFSRVLDNKLLNELNSGNTVKVYRAMQVIDGKLYPPMAAKVKDATTGKNTLVEPTELGTWYQADERPDLIDPKTGTWKLDKANGGTVPAAYNPYWHTSKSLLNDQFSSAWDRSNLVTVECEVPESELTSGYKAEFAKDSVGEMSWHSGPVSSKLAKLGNPRKVILSRYVKVNRIVSDAEAASKIAEMLKGTDISIPDNTVTPSLKAELQKLGVEISEPSGLNDNTIKKHYANLENKIKFSRSFDDELLLEDWITDSDDILNELRAELNNETTNAPKRIKRNAEQMRNVISGDSFNLEGNRATYTDERIDRVVKDHDYGNGRSDAYLTYINPKDFLKLTTLGYTKFIDNETNRGRVSELDIDKLRSETQTPFLDIEMNASGARVTGHEGRHRMIAMMNAGIENVPVILIDRANRYSDGKSVLPQLNLHGQSFYSNRSNARISIADALPITKANTDEIRNRFGGESSLQFSRDFSSSQTIDELRESNRQMKEQLKEATKFRGEAEEEIAYLRKQFTLTEVKEADTRSVNRLVKTYLEEYGSGRNTDKAKITEGIKKIGELYLNAKTIDDALADRIYDEGLQVASEIIRNAEALNDAEAERYSKIKDYLKKTPVNVSIATQKNMVDFGDFKKRNKPFKISSTAQISVTEMYNDLHEMAPDLFIELDDESAMLYQIESVLQEEDSIYFPAYGSLDIAMATDELAMRIVGDSISGKIESVASTFADRKQASIDLRDQKLIEQAKEYQQRIKDLRAYKNEKIESTRKRYRQMLENEKAYRIEKVQKLKDHYREMRLQKHDSKVRQNLLKIANRLKNKKMTTPNRELINQFIGNLDTVAVTLTQKGLDDLSKLRDWYDDQKDKNPDFIPNASIEERLKRLSRKHISDLTIDEVVGLTEVLLHIENRINLERYLVNDKQKRDIYLMAEESVSNINNSFSLGNLKAFEKIDELFVEGTLSPVRFMHRLSGFVESDPLYELTNALADGQRKQLKFEMDSNKMFDEWINNKEFMRRITGHNSKGIEIEGRGKNNETVKATISPDMRMYLYLSLRNEDNLNHIAIGGITCPNWAEYKKGDMGKAFDKGTTIIKLTPSQIREICKDMPDDEKAFAERASLYFNTTSKDAINETSEALEGFSLAGVDNYLPITTNPDFTKADFEGLKKDGTVEGLGFLKERVKAGNPIMVPGLSYTLSKSIKGAAKYYGMAIPVRNFNKVYRTNTTYWGVDNNGETLNSNFNDSIPYAIKQKWGARAQKYIEDFMTDIQTGRPGSDGILSKILASSRGNYAGSVLSMNLGVAVKQAASYPTAGAVLGGAPLMYALADLRPVDTDLIAKYTPMLWVRDKNTELSSAQQYTKQNVLQKALNSKALNWITDMDLLTIKRLWRASEGYVMIHNKALEKGSDAFYREVANVFNRVVEETQPNYTAMQRPALLRSDDSLTRSLMMFKTQPFQNFNILYDSLGNLSAKMVQYKANPNDETKGNLKKASINAFNAVTSQMVQTAVFAAMTMVWGMLRGKDDKWRDDEGELTLQSILKHIGRDMLSGYASMIPFGSDVYEYVSSKVFDEKYYGFESMTDSVITDITTAFDNLQKEMDALQGDIKNGNFDVTKHRFLIDKLASPISKVFGVPYDNVKNLVNMIFLNTVKGATKAGKLDYYDGQLAYLYWTEDTSKDSKPSEFYDIMLEAYMDSPDSSKKVYDSLIEHGFNGDKIKDKIEARMKEIEGVKSVNDLSQRFAPPDLNGNMSAYDTELASSKIADREKLSKLYDDMTKKYGITPKEDGTLYDIVTEMFMNGDENFEKAYSELLENGFVYDKIKTKIEKAMMEKEGVDSVTKLSQRFEDPFPEYPDEDGEKPKLYYDNKVAEEFMERMDNESDAFDIAMKTLQDSKYYDELTKSSKEKVENSISKMYNGDWDSLDNVRKYKKEAGIDETKYVLYNAALYASDSDNNGKFTKEEKVDAMKKLISDGTFTKKQASYLFDQLYKKDNPFK